jgi:lipopolysaccharide biosynthesis glycosyltransferase
MTRSPKGSVSGDVAEHRTPLEVLCSCDGAYLPHAATMLCSLLEHNEISRIHIFYKSIGNSELTKLSSLTEKYKTELVCYEMVPEVLEDFSLHTNDWFRSVANYFRLLAPRILPTDLEKILYLDSDIIVRRSLMDLWDTNLGDKAFAGVEDAFWQPTLDYVELPPGAKYDYVELPPGAKYFNSGVMLINLNYWRRYNVYERAVEFMRDNPDKLNYVDQDALNAILVNQWIDLPAIWNDQARSVGHVPVARNENIEDPAIVHFVGGDKPWSWSCKHPFKSEYRKYRLKTPWSRYNEEGEPRFRFIRAVAKIVLPDELQQLLRSYAKRTAADKTT